MLEVVYEVEKCSPFFFDLLRIVIDFTWRTKDCWRDNDDTERLDGDGYEGNLFIDSIKTTSLSPSLARREIPIKLAH